MKICIIGCVGHVGQAVSEMKRSPDAEFVGIAPGTPAEVTMALDHFGIPVYDDYKKMLDELSPDYAIVSPIFGYTSDIIVECAKRGINVFSEKPVATTLEQLEKLEEAVNKSGIRFSAMHFLRFSPFLSISSQGMKTKPLRPRSNLFLRS